MRLVTELLDALKPFLVELFAVLKPIIGILVSFLAFRVSKWVKAQEEKAKSATATQDWDFLVAFARLTVQRVEQLDITHQIFATGEQKKQLAETNISNFAARFGVTITPEEIDTLIESALRDGVHKGWDVIETATATLATDEPAQ